MPLVASPEARPPSRTGASAFPRSRSRPQPFYYDRPNVPRSLADAYPIPQGARPCLSNSVSRFMTPFETHLGPRYPPFTILRSPAIELPSTLPSAVIAHQATKRRLADDQQPLNEFDSFERECLYDAFVALNQRRRHSYRDHWYIPRLPPWCKAFQEIATNLAHSVFHHYYHHDTTSFDQEGQTLGLKIVSFSTHWSSTEIGYVVWLWDLDLEGNIRAHITTVIMPYEVQVSYQQRRNFMTDLKVQGGVAQWVPGDMSSPAHMYHALRLGCWSAHNLGSSSPTVSRKHSGLDDCVAKFQLRISSPLPFQVCVHSDSCASESCGVSDP